VELVAGTSGITALTGDVTATGPGSAASTVVGVRSQPVSATTPTEGQVWVFLSGVWTPTTLALGGGGSTLQDAYNAGPDITQGLSGTLIAIVSVHSIENNIDIF
jgi:hypothetical protein